MADQKDKDIFKEMFESLTPKDVFEGKYGDGSPDVLTPQSTDEIEPETDIEQVRQVRELRTMEDAFEGVERLQHSKRRKRSDEKSRDEQFNEPSDITIPTSPASPKTEIKPVAETALSRWEMLAEETKLGTVIDLRNLRTDDALRTLGIDIPRRGCARLVYEQSDDDGFGRDAIEKWLQGFGAPFAFSPNSNAQSGLVAIGKLPNHSI